MYQIYSGKAYAVCLRLSADTKTAEDLTVKTFLSAWDNISYLRYDMPFAGWLTGIAVYTFLQEVLLKKEPGSQTSSNISFPQSYQKNLIEESILRLPDKERYFAVLHLVEKYSLQETADFLAMPTSEARKLRDRVIQRLLESVDFVYNADQIIERIESIPFKIEPSQEVWEHIVSHLRQEKVEISEKQEKEIEEELKDRSSAGKEEKSEKRKKKKKEKQVKIRRKSNFNTEILKRTAVIAGVTAVGIMIIYSIFSGGVTWDITEFKGRVLINKIAVSEEVFLENGMTVTSKENSGFQIYISVTGNIKALENTSIKRTSDSSLQLIRGNIQVLKDDDSAPLTVTLPNAAILDAQPGGQYEVESAPDLSSLIKNKSGWIKINAGDNELYLLSGYECKIKETGEAGIPYHKQSSEEVKSLLHQFSFSSEDKDDIADRLIILTRNNDLVSLWNILYFVSPMKRGDIYDYFAKLIIMPPSITKEDIIYLKKDIMMSLLAELEPALEI